LNTILKNTRKEGKKHILFAFIISTFVFLLSCNENSDRVVVFPKVYTELGEITGTIANPDSIQAPRVSPFIMPKGEFLKAPQIIPRKKKQSSIHSIPSNQIFPSLSSMTSLVVLIPSSNP
jgi:hypothetical protein